VTVLEVIQRSANYLAERGVESPRLQVELILAQVLHTPRLKLYLDFNRTLTEPEADAARLMVKRRGQREPLQHILGSTSFCGLEIEVNSHVLIPRPETEILAERAWNLLNAQPLVLDLGTGSGCIAIAIAHHCRTAIVHATDISPAALDTARRNAKRHNVVDRISFYEGALFQSVAPGTQYQLIVTNPPYIPTAEIADLQPEVRDHDPGAALDGGPDGLAIIREIAANAPQFLVPGGTLLLEFGDGQGAAVRELFSRPPWEAAAIEKDFSRRERILIAQRNVS